MARAQDHNYEGRKEKSSSRLGTEVKRGCGILRGGGGFFGKSDFSL